MSRPDDLAPGEGGADPTAVLAAEAHRLSNVLQVVSSMLAYRRRRLTDATARQQIEWVERVVQALMPHTRPSIRIQGGFGDLMAQQVASWMPVCAARAIELEFATDGVIVTDDKHITLTLALNELLTNAVKYAFPDRGGKLSVALRRVADDAAELAVADNGIGLEAEPHGGSGLGLLSRMAQQLGGSLAIDGSAGTTVRLRFPLDEAG